ncbi:MAG TPA: right-handed parallel beta-helix repeat-containing protein [Tepidisphaeraceae bacterium]
MLSHTYFVAPTGNDAWRGTLARPFKTIQAAANAARSGDTVEIEGGTYRETVQPARSGVTFTNYNGQTVIIAGTDTLGGWSKTGGGIYQASMPWDLGEGNNQVFVDGQMVNEARWPNSSPDPLHPTNSTVASYSDGILYDPSITQADGYWTGATITITPGDAWVAYTGTVTDSGPGWLKVSLPPTSIWQVETPVAGNGYFLSGKFEALDSPGEWYRDSDGTLCLWDPAGDNPALHDVEVKRREYGFDLTGVSDTTIQGIDLFACTVHTDSGSTSTTLNGITAAYITQFTNPGGSGWNPPGPDGIELNGADSILENSTIAFSAGDGVYVGGTDVQVTNNVIHDVDYSGSDAAGVRVDAANAMVDHNTIYNAGRDGINLQSAPAKILDNVIHDFMLLTYDGGAVYTMGVDGQGSEIAGNTMFDAHKDNYNGLDATGIVLDGASSNFVVHDNITANVDSSLKANDTSFNEQIYNNQFGAIQYAIESNGWIGYAYDWSGSTLYNNVFYNPNLKLGANITETNDTFASGSPTIDVSAPVDPPMPVPAPAFVTPLLAGSIQGGFRAQLRTARAATSYALSATAALPGFAAARVTGTAIGAIRQGNATGTLRVATTKGAVTLALTSPGATVSTPTPSEFAYTVTRATASYKQFAGTTGTLDLTFTPANAKGTLGAFSLLFTND